MPSVEDQTESSRPCVDDLSIAPSDELLRRISPQYLSVEDGKPVVSSGAFRTDEMSVHLASVANAEQALEGYSTHSLVGVLASEVRRLGLKIYRDPPPDSHAIVCPRATKSQAKRLAAICTFRILGQPAVPPQL